MNLIYNEEENLEFKEISKKLNSEFEDPIDSILTLGRLQDINLQNVSIEELDKYLEFKNLSKYYFSENYRYNEMKRDYYSSLAHLPVVKSENFDFIHDGIIFVHDLEGIKNQYINFSPFADCNLTNYGSIEEKVIKIAKYMYLLKLFCKYNSINEPNFSREFLQKLGAKNEIEKVFNELQELKEIRAKISKDISNSVAILKAIAEGEYQTEQKLNEFGYLKCSSCFKIEHPLLNRGFARQEDIGREKIYKCFECLYEEQRDQNI